MHSSDVEAALFDVSTSLAQAPVRLAIYGACVESVNTDRGQLSAVVSSCGKEKPFGHDSPMYEFIINLLELLVESYI